MIIVYTSNTGNTRQYANYLKEDLGLPAYHLERLPENAYDEDAIYLGWIMAGSVAGYKKAAAFVNIKCVVGVGMSPEVDGMADKLREKMSVPDDVPVFYLQGGYDRKKLKGYHKALMVAVEKVILRNFKDMSEEEKAENPTYRMIKEGYSVVSKDRLAGVLAWAKDQV